MLARSFGSVPLIHHDFMDGDGEVLFLTPRGWFDEAWWGDLDLTEGLPLRFFAVDTGVDGSVDYLVADGIAHYDDDRGRWVARLPPEGEVSTATAGPGHWCRQVDWSRVEDAMRDTSSRLGRL